MNHKFIPFLSLLCILVLASACAEDRIAYKQGKSVMKLGDEPGWSAQDLDEHDWERRIELTDGRVYWSRTKVEILDTPESLRPFGVIPHVYGEYEVFWDGVLIGKNGNPGRELELGPEGKMWKAFGIPSHLAGKGEHVIAIRSSLYYFPDHVGVFGIELNYYDNLLTKGPIRTSFMHIFAGALLLASIYFLFLFLSNKKEYTTLIFSIICFLLFVHNLLEFFISYAPIHYKVHHTRLNALEMVMLSVSFLVPLYFSKQFPYPRQKVLLVVYTGVLLLLYSFKSDNTFIITRDMSFAMSVFSLGIVVFGVYKKMKGARLVLLTLPSAVLIGLATSFMVSLYAGISLILLGMFYVHSLRIKEQRLAYENSLVQSTRLKLELVKKNIQPHFLLNTLTSLVDWVEEAPKKGVMFIEALAKEFDLFNQIEDQTMIPITQEIELCKSHLEIMEYRKEISYFWEEEGIDLEQKVPPAIFHTLLENGITHSLPLDDNSIRFKLVHESNDEYRSYTFLTFALGVRQGKSREEGTGLKYIKARLTESYQSKWSLDSESTEHGWKNVIKIYH
ncbi:MAG: histidine kinase [Roseivirga sp.]|nr:histidine kinase [Roseivirga sp.]